MQKLEALWAKTAFNQKDKGEKYVKLLIEKGTFQEIVNVNNPDEFSVPPNFDRELFRRGQDYYHEFQNCFDFGTFIGILSLFSVESIVETLACTNRTSTPATAYKRYTETILYHHYFLTDSPEDPLSLCCRAIKSVRRKHKHGSMAAQKHNIGFINQRDMVLTLFSFFGFTIANPDFFRLPLDEDNLRAAFYFWRVIGYMLGIDDRFNIYYGDVETIASRSKAILKHIFLPALLNAPAKFQQMSSAALEGYKAIVPEMNLETMRFFVNLHNRIPGYYLTEEDRQEQLEYIKKYPHYIGSGAVIQIIKRDIKENPEICSAFKKLNYPEQMFVRFIAYLIGQVYSQSLYLRKIINFISVWRFKLSIKYPLLAMWKFGKEHAYIDNSIMESYLKQERAL